MSTDWKTRREKKRGRENAGERERCTETCSYHAVQTLCCIPGSSIYAVSSRKHLLGAETHRGSAYDNLGFQGRSLLRPVKLVIDVRKMTDNRVTHARGVSRSFVTTQLSQVSACHVTSRHVLLSRAILPSSTPSSDFPGDEIFKHR